MHTGTYITDITHARTPDGSPRVPAQEIAELAALDISVSDTETTGLSRERHGVTEIASTRAVVENGEPKLKLFQSYVLPLKPEFRDYLALCHKAAAEKKPAPPYDRRRYEYEIDPKALEVTGTEIIRKPLDGPITGLKVKGKKVSAAPFYEVLPEFMAFTRSGTRDVYYNAPFDLPFLGKLQEDVQAHDLARADRHQTLQHNLRGLPNDVKKALRELETVSYAEANPTQQARLVGLMHAVTQVAEPYRNSASYRCLYHGYLAEKGFGASNTLDDAYRSLIDPAFSGRHEHMAVEDVTMTARLALRLQDHATGSIPTMTDLYHKLVRKFDDGATAEPLDERQHRHQPDRVAGDVQLNFSADPKKLDDKAQRFWHFLEGFDEVTRVNSRAPHHLVDIDRTHHRVIINAERKNPLSINFLKKCIFFQQVMDSPTIHTLAPFDSTGTKMDVVLHARDASGERITIEGVPYASLRANFAFINAHPAQAEELLQLIAALRKKDRRVGMVLLSERDDGSLNIRIKGHQRAFGECLLHLPVGASILAAIPALQQDLLSQLKLGAIPYVNGFGPSEQEEETQSDATEELDDASSKRAAAPAMVQIRPAPEGQMQLVVSDTVLASMAFRLERSLAELVAQGITTRHGPIAVRLATPDPHAQQQSPRYVLTGTMEAFHDYPDLNPMEKDGPRGEKSSNLVRDASWLLYRLGRLPGTYGISIQGDMGTIDQRDGVSLETLGLLYQLGIPFKAYNTSIKVDIHQLMKNAFHWSVALQRAQEESVKDNDASKTPPEFLKVVQGKLLRGHGDALEMNEKRECWLVPHTQAEGQLKSAHQLDQTAPDMQLAFRKKELVVEKSDIVGPHRFHIEPTMDGGFTVTANPVLLQLAARLAGRKADVALRGADRLQVGKHSERTMRPMLEKASLFLYELSKSTGSQRVAAESIDFTPDGTHVHLNLPQLSFLDRPRLMNDMLMVHRELADTTADGSIRRLQTHLPDPTQVDERRADLVHLSETVHHEQDKMLRLSSALTQYLQLLGGAEFNTDPTSIDLTQELEQELTTLGLLLHELAGTGNTLKKVAGADARRDVHTAQERLSNVAFGSKQLKEDIAVARKALLGGDHSRGLLQEVGGAMATMMDEYAMQLSAYDPRSDLATLMQPYRDKTLSLLGEKSEAEFQNHAWRAAFRRLRGIALEQSDMPDTALRYLLSEAYEAISPEQQGAIIRLYREHGSAEARDYVRSCFSEAKKSDVTGTKLLKQYDLLTQPSSRPQEPEAWLAQNPAIAASIESEITGAYATRGNHYLNMSEITPPQDEANRRSYLQQASHCFARAGWEEEKIVRALSNSSKRTFDSNRKAHTRERIGMEVDLDSKNIKEHLQVIDEPGHEERVFELLMAKRYSTEQRESERLTDNVMDPYYVFKQRKALLSSVEKVLKETHDLLMVKYHHVRDLQGLLVMLQQDSAMAGRLSDESATQIGEIGQKIRTHPEMVGLHEQTVPNIRRLIDTQQDQLRSHVLQQLAEGGAEPVLMQNGAIEIPTDALSKMFDQWCQHKNRSKEIPPHLYAWVDRAAGRLFAVPMVKTVTLDKHVTGITCTIDLPQDKVGRVKAWAALRLASVGMGLNLPATPDEGGEQTLQVPFVRTAVRGQMAFDRFASAHDVRTALSAFAETKGASFAKRTGKRPSLDASLQRAEAHGIDPQEILKTLRAAGQQQRH